MKRSLVGGNVWLALLVRQHEHHARALRWVDSLEAGDALMCRFVQLGLIRLLANRTVIGSDAVSAATAWQLIATLLEDERVEFASEPADLDSHLPALWKYPVPTGKLGTDAYRVAFSLSLSCRLATPDRGFRAFPEVPVERI